ncbi:UNVERIFIED_CONTAM: hypothetical protein FKN15_040604 [Acipenser sinensis]
MDRNALAELLQALESRRDAEERRREERYTALIERVYTGCCGPAAGPECERGCPPGRFTQAAVALLQIRSVERGCPPGRFTLPA